MTEKEKMLAGKIYDTSDEELAAMRLKAHKLSARYNSVLSLIHILRNLLMILQGQCRSIREVYGCSVTEKRFRFLQMM